MPGGIHAGLPKGHDPARFESLLRGSAPHGRRSRDRIADDFQEIIFSGLEGLPAGRDLPDALLSVAREYILAPEDPRHDDYGGIGVEKFFGIKDERSHDSFPASAWRGPWIHVLRSHPAKALEFVLDIFNQSVRSYVSPQLEGHLEPAWEISLEFADGTRSGHWGNPRLWSMYRGLSVGPYILQSILMAFESWLFEYAKTFPRQLDSTLVDILRRSESASVAAVAASVATAHPQLSGNALVVLLSARDYVRIDLGRRTAESQTAVMSGMLSGLQPENKVYDAERKTANSLPHRRQSLEDAIVRLQIGPFASKVHAALDRHNAILPPISEQDDEDRTWRLALHRMDLRQCTISEVEVPETSEEPDGKPPSSSQRLVRFDPIEPAPDLKEMMEESASRLGPLEKRLRLFNWAYGSFKRQGSDSHDPAIWGEILAEAMSQQEANEHPVEPGRGRLGILAAVCVRDHWEEMKADQRDWCVGRVCAEITATADRWHDAYRMQRFDMEADRACAWVVSSLERKSLTDLRRTSIREALAAAVTHPNMEVRWHAVWGLAQNLPAVGRELATRCINALARETSLAASEQRARNAVPYAQRRELSNIGVAAADAVRKAFWTPDGIPSNAYEELDVHDWSGADTNAQILTVLAPDPEHPAALPAFVRASKTLVSWWDEDRVSRREPGHGRRNHEAEAAISERIQGFVMLASYEAAKLVLDPILGAIDNHPREVHPVIEGLTVIEDRVPNTVHYWNLWQLFADGIRHANWVSYLDRDHPVGREMVSAIFLTSWWKDTVRHWKSLEGHAPRVHALFEALPPSWIVLDSYVRFLYHIGEQSLPEAFVRISKSLSTTNRVAMLADSNTVFMLVVLLQRHVYGRPLELKREPVIRNAVLHLLDILIEAGSAAAFRMRDDFVTPVVPIT
jgi:hypothetical protein